MDKTICILAAIIALAGIEIVALMNGIDGKMLLAVVAAISGLGGYSLKGVIDALLNRNKTT